MMPSWNRRTTIAWLVTGLGMSGCASPDPTLYTLAAVPGPVVPVRHQNILLRSVNVARYLERPELVRWSENYQLNVRSNAWWGEPLSAMIGRVLSENLYQRAQGATIFSEDSGMSSNVDATLVVTIQRMDEDRSGQVQLLAQVVLIPTANSKTPRNRTVRLHTTPASADLRSEVAALSTALGLLADQITQMLQQ